MADINEMLDELDAAVRLVSASLARIREYTAEPEEDEDDGLPIQERDNRQAQMLRARRGRTDRDFASFNDLNM